MLSFSHPVQAAKRPAGPSLEVTLEEATLIHLLLEQVELSMDEMPSFLSLQAPFEQLVANSAASSSGQELVSLALSEANVNDLLVFMQRMSLRGLGARQVSGIIKKVTALLPPEAPRRHQAPLGPSKVQLSLSLEEALLLEKKLHSVQISVPEVPIFLSVYEPLSHALSQEEAQEALVLRLPQEGIEGLRSFMERFELMGHQVKLIQGLQARLSQLS